MRVSNSEQWWSTIINHHPWLWFIIWMMLVWFWCVAVGGLLLNTYVWLPFCTFEHDMFQSTICDRFDDFTSDRWMGSMVGWSIHDEDGHAMPCTSVWIQPWRGSWQLPILGSPAGCDSVRVRPWASQDLGGVPMLRRWWVNDQWSRLMTWISRWVLALPARQYIEPIWRGSSRLDEAGYGYGCVRMLKTMQRTAHAHVIIKKK